MEKIALVEPSKPFEVLQSSAWGLIKVVFGTCLIYFKFFASQLACHWHTCKLVLSTYLSMN